MTDGKKYFIFLLFTVFVHYTATSQHQFQIWSGNLGGALYKQTFGVGNDHDTIPGPALPAGITDFAYNNNGCPPAGSYSIVQKVNPKYCSNGKWLLISLDHRQEKFGNMMLVHNVASAASRIVYVDTVNQDLCAGTVYEFSAAIINVDTLATCSSIPDFPSFMFSLEDASGNVLKSYTTPQISAAPARTSAGPLWKYSVYGFDDTMPVNMNKIILKITLVPFANYLNCNNDFAIDDIMFSPAGPAINIAFDGLPPGSIVAGFCFQDNKSVSMSGAMDPFYPHPAFQWQETSNNGITWQDIPGAGKSSYSQNFPVSDTFLFRLRGSDASLINKVGCGSVSDVLKVEVDGIPSDISATSNSPVCVGQVIKFNATGGASYIWHGPNGFTDDIATPDIFHSSLADSGTYYVQIKSFGGCTAKDSTNVKIIGTNLTLGPDQSICKGQSVQLRANGGLSYVWSPATGLSNTRIADPIATPEVTTTYSVTVSDQSGCLNSDSVIIKLLNSITVKAAISGLSFLCRPYDSASFKDMSLGEIETWHWDFGNGVSSSVQNPSVQNFSIADNTTDYRVRLTITDTAGCSDTTYHVMKVENNCYIAIPSAFTPNGDGLNDYLYPLNAYKATQLLFRVFNRNGQLVFETRDWTKKWDGTFEGNPLTTDVFVWELGYTDAANKKIFLKGSTLLIR